MSKTRYAIVRVNFVCPNTYEGISYNFVCQNNGPIKNFQCEKCRYGDTKEQLEKKVAQVIKTKTDNGIIVRYREDSISVEELAKAIIEFLGVE